MRSSKLGLILLMLLAAPLAGQELTGRIEGSVTDEQGAVIAGAQVTATHVATNFTYRATTNALGRFAIPRVPVGSYRVVVEATGFRRTTVQNVLVEVAGTADLNVTLQVGAMQEEVTVTAETTQEIVNTVDAQLGAVVDNRRVLELPLNGRNPSHLLLLQAGVYFERNPDGEGDKLLVHGMRHRAVGITLDGVDTQDNYNRASSIMLDFPLNPLTVEGVQEFRVVTGLGTAEFGRGGAHINAITKGGSNDIHGSLFWFHRNTALNANDFFNNAAQPKVETPPLLRHQFGGSVGGPIVRDKTFFFFSFDGTRETRGIPVLRTTYTAQARAGTFRFLNDIGTQGTTPEAVAANPGLLRSVNLFECSAAVQAALGRDCVDSRFNNAFPSTVDPLIAQIMAMVPAPNNFDVGDGVNTGGFRFNAKAKTMLAIPTFRLDHRFNDKHSFYGSFQYNDRDIDGDFINGREPPFPAVGSIGRRVTVGRLVSATLTSTLQPNLINELRFGVNTGMNGFLVVDPLGQPFTLDFANITDPVHQAGNGDDVRRMHNYHLRNTVSWVRGRHQMRFGGEFRHIDVNTYSLDELFPDLDFTRSLFPPGWTEANLLTLSQGCPPCTDIETVDLNRAGQMMNEFMGAIGEREGRFNVRSLTGPFEPGLEERRLFRTRELDLFFNDTWQFSRNLTLNLGMRWEYATVPFETRGLSLVPEGGFEGVFGVSGSAGLFNPGVLAGKPCTVPTIPAPTGTDMRNLINACATLNVPGGSKNGQAFWKDDFNNVAPVISLAWDPWGNGRTAIRAGYRLSYFQDAFAIIGDNLDDNEGLVVDQDCEPSSGNCLTNPLFLRTGIPGLAAPTFALPAVRTILDSSTIDFRTYAPDLETPYYQEWTLSISREFWKNWAVEARYVGNRGIKLRRVMDFNEPNIFAFDPNTGTRFLDDFIRAQANMAICRANSAACIAAQTAAGISAANRTVNNYANFGLPGQVSIPLLQVMFGAVTTAEYRDSDYVTALDFNGPGQFAHRLTNVETASGVRGGRFLAAVLRGQLPLNFFQANPFVASARALVNNSFSNYHGVEIEVRRRWAAGLTLQANYGFGKALADYDGDENTLLNEDRITLRDIRYEYGEIAPRQQVNANWIWELPWGSGRRWAIGNRVLEKIAGGWQFGGIFNWRSGRPLSINATVGTFTRSALSNSNRVDLTTPMTTSELRALTGARTLPTGTTSSGVFWIDPSLNGTLFVLPQPGRAGTLRQTPIFGPNRWTLDFNLAKREKITEAVMLEFRWEVFNVFNHTNFDAPTTDITSISFGQIFRTVTNSRLMQFAFRLSF